MKSKDKQKILSKWTSEEDQLLRYLRQQKSENSWKNIATEINLQLHGVERTGKQCRQRYTNYLRFDLKELSKNCEWNLRQDELLFKSFMLNGPKWVLICKQFPGRSQNSLKNRFYNAIGRIQRKIRKVQLRKKIKNKKPISSNRLINIFHKLGHFLYNKCPDKATDQQRQHQQHRYMMLAHDLMKIAINNNEPQSEQQLFSIIKSIHDFNLELKARNSEQTCAELSEILLKENLSYIFSEQKLEKVVQANSQPKQIKKDKSSYQGAHQENQLYALRNKQYLLPELSQDNNFKNYEKNLDQELCIIQKRQYRPEEYTFHSSYSGF